MSRMSTFSGSRHHLREVGGVCASGLRSKSVTAIGVVGLGVEGTVLRRLSKGSVLASRGNTLNRRVEVVGTEVLR